MRNTTWTKESALGELDRLTAEISNLRKTSANSAEHVRWHQKVVSFFEEVFGRDSRSFSSFIMLTWRREGHFLVGGIGDPAGNFDPQGAINREHHKACPVVSYPSVSKSRWEMLCPDGLLPRPLQGLLLLPPCPESSRLIYLLHRPRKVRTESARLRMSDLTKALANFSFDDLCYDVPV